MSLSWFKDSIQVRSNTLWARSHGTPPGRYPAPTYRPPLCRHSWAEPLLRDGHFSGRYASYWNAFLLLFTAALFLQNVSWAQITYTEDKVFSASHVSSIPDIPDDALSVKIRKLRMDRIPANSFAHLASCTEMKIWNSTVNAIDNGAFNGLDSLHELKLWSNAIHAIESGAFAD